MKKKTIVIISIGCLSISCIIILVLTFLLLQKDIEKEFRPLNIEPNAPDGEEVFNIPQSSTENQLERLSYISIMTSGYTDDADPEYEGISIDISYFDEKSESINFNNTPINIQIDIYGYHDVMDAFEANKRELVYQGMLEIDHSMSIGEIFGNYIHIPYDYLNIDPRNYYEFGEIVVTVNTPVGFFSDSVEFVQLYE